MAANVLDVVAKAWTVATNFLKLCTGSADRMDSALGAGASGVNCAADRIYTGFWEEAAGSGLSLGWAMVLGSKSMGID